MLSLVRPVTAIVTIGLVVRRSVVSAESSCGISQHADRWPSRYNPLVDDTGMPEAEIQVAQYVPAICSQFFNRSRLRH